MASSSTTTVGSAAFQKKYALRDMQAGVITGFMAIPLSIGIAIMSDYPIKVGLATVVLACTVGWINAWFRPGNYVGAPGIAAGLAPVLALGVAKFGMQNMAFLIFLTSFMQAVVWKFNWQRYILKAVPHYLVEGLLAGIGLKIGLKFLTMAYEVLPGEAAADAFWNLARVKISLISLAAFIIFIYLFKKFKAVNPAIAYFAVIIGGIIVAQFIAVPMISVKDVPLVLRLPIPHFADPMLWVYAIGFCLLLTSVDVIEQVVSNAAIEKIDPLERKCNSNNSLMAIWIANMGASFFGGMTNLDGLAKSTTNRLAGAYTKFSLLFVGSVIAFFVVNNQYLEYLPKFSLAAIMIFTGWKMIEGLLHVANEGRYELMLAILCGLLVFKLGIFEGLLIALVIHSLVAYIVFVNVDKHTTSVIFKNFLGKFKDEDPYTE